MRVLVIGGTRLLGRSLVKRLLSAGHNVTVLSHRPEKCAAGAECIDAERSQGLKKLSGRVFDFTFDFLAYDGKTTAEALENIDNSFYILISSAWMVRLNSLVPIDEPVKKINEKEAGGLPEVTHRYLIGKMGAEDVVLRSREEKREAAVLRLPIFFGEGEHTGRLDFYQQRINDGSPIICVDGGYNLAQIAWTEDISKAIIEWMPFANEFPIWDGIPDEGTRVREIIKIIAKHALKELNLIDITSNQLSKEFPEYLVHEPLWRERPIMVGKGNIFNRTASKPAPISEWLCGLKGKGGEPNTELRKKEILYLKDFR